jgi:lysophospholipase L1-like esterase
MRFQMRTPVVVLALYASLMNLSPAAIAENAVLQKGNRVAIVGDSITEQKLYSKFIETYLLACYPELNVQCFQFGWSGERAPGFASRMENDLVPWHPDVVTTCYGMNDGSYRAYDDGIGKAYEQGMRQIVSRMKEAGATVVVGSPGVVDSFTWKREDPDFDQVYNDNLERLGKIAQQLAKESQFPHADVFGAMKHAMIAAKAALGEEYHVAGGDGVHPGPNGQLVMAYAFLKAMGLDGNIGVVTVDLGNNQAEASAGHRIINNQKGALEIESSRYPFCFSGAENDPNGTRSILPYTPFNQDLNRFTLKVNNLMSSQAEVTFGKETKTFSKEQLAEGINLAAEFLENPFSTPFNQVLNEVGQKQAAETTMIKGFITNFRQIGPLANDAEVQSALNTLRKKMMEANEAAHAKAKAAIVPVRYTLVIKAEA